MSLHARRSGGRLAKSSWALSTGLFPQRQGRNSARTACPEAAARAQPLVAPRQHRDRRPFLLARGRIQAALRALVRGAGLRRGRDRVLQVSPGNETHLHAFATELIGPDGARRPLYLHTSPEFACKKLLAAGEERIFTFAPVFRNRERGRPAPSGSSPCWNGIGPARPTSS